MSNTSLAIILLVTIVLTIVVLAVYGISSIQQAKAQTPGQNGKDESDNTGDKDLLQADATISLGY
jgi:flagellar basal body-associated protein FliL